MKDVFTNILFPLMLYSKPRQHSVELVWDLIEKSVPKTGPGLYELLSGCAEIWTTSKAESTEDVQEKMAMFNMKLATRMAGQYSSLVPKTRAHTTMVDNVLSSNDFSQHVDDLVAKLRHTNGHVRLFACVIARALLRRLTGGHQVDTALKIVQALDLDQLAESSDSVGNVSADELRQVSIPFRWS